MRSLLSLGLTACEWFAVAFAAAGAFCAWQSALPWPGLAAATALVVAGLVRGRALRRAGAFHVDVLFGGFLPPGRPANRNEGGRP